MTLFRPTSIASYKDQCNIRLISISIVRAISSSLMFTDIPDNLRSGPVRLRYEHTIPAQPDRGKVAYYHFKILNEKETIVGHINFRVGDTRHVTLCAGHVGFEVLPNFRGNSYSYSACLALAPFIRRHYERIVLTADPANKASKRIIEKLGTSFIDEIGIPADDPAYEGEA